MAKKLVHVELANGVSIWVNPDRVCHLFEYKTGSLQNHMQPITKKAAIAFGGGDEAELFTLEPLRVLASRLGFILGEPNG